MANYEVYSNGQVKTFESLADAIQFCEDQAAKHSGSDIWQGDVLVKTYLYNCFTGKIGIS